MGILDWDKNGRLVVRNSNMDYMTPRKSFKASTETLEYYSVGSPVFYMKNNRVCKGHIQRVDFIKSLQLDGNVSTSISYMILEGEKYMTDVESCDTVNGTIVAFSREDLIAKL